MQSWSVMYTYIILVSMLIWAIPVFISVAVNMNCKQPGLLSNRYTSQSPSSGGYFMVKLKWSQPQTSSQCLFNCFYSFEFSSIGRMSTQLTWSPRLGICVYISEKDRGKKNPDLADSQSEILDIFSRQLQLNEAIIYQTIDWIDASLAGKFKVSGLVFTWKFM